VSSGSDVDVTVPENSTVSLPLGAEVSGVQWGAGQVIFVGAGTVNVRTAETLKTRTQYSGWMLKQMFVDEWWLTGDLELA